MSPSDNNLNKYNQLFFRQRIFDNTNVGRNEALHF